MKKTKYVFFEKAGSLIVHTVVFLLYVIIIFSLSYVRDFIQDNKQDKIQVFADSSSFNRYISFVEEQCEKISREDTNENKEQLISEIETNKQKLMNYIQLVRNTNSVRYEKFQELERVYSCLESSLNDFFSTMVQPGDNSRELKYIYSVRIKPYCTNMHQCMYYILKQTSEDLDQEIFILSKYVDITMVMITAVYLLCLFIYAIFHRRFKRQHKQVMYNNSLLEILSQNIDSVFVVRNEENTRNEYVSKNSKRVLGFDYEALLKDDQLIYNQMSKAWSSRIKREHIRNSDLPAWNITAQYTHPDTGEMIYLNKDIFYIKIDGAKVKHKYIYLYENQTETIKAQTSLEEALQAARTASEAKSRFLSNMSHDIRTPMHAIIGMTTLARMNIQDQDKVIDCLSKITTSSNHLLGLVSQILDMSRIESGKMTLNNQYFSLIHFINNIVDIVSPRIKSKNICFIVDRSKLETDMVYGDELRLSQIIINFIDNATKYNVENGNIRFTITEQPGMKQNSREITFEIKDTGCGMTDEFRKKIFEPFERDSLADKNKIEGTGLGMSISRNLINMMGGQVEVESQVNKGTTIRINLGFIVEDNKNELSDTAVTLEYKVKSDFDFTNRRIFVVDDMDMNISIVRGFLEKTGIIVESVNSGEEAVNYIESMPQGYLGMIFLDIHMTGIDGYETCRRIRAMNRTDTGRIPIVAITADAFTEDILKAKDAGMNGHISKPFQIEELLNVVREFIND